MKRILLCLILFPLFFPSRGATLPDASFDLVLQKIDSALLCTKQYEEELEFRISNLKALGRRASSYAERYNISRQLVECYENYNIDSTYHYIDYCKSMALKADRPDWLVSMTLYQIDVYLQMNMLDVARVELQKMDLAEMDHTQRMTYYSEYYTLCEQARKQSQALDDAHLSEYNDLAAYFLEKIYTEASPEDDYCKYQLMHHAIELGKGEELTACFEAKMKDVSGMTEREIAEKACVLFVMNSSNHNYGQSYAWLAYAMEHSFHHAFRDMGTQVVSMLIEMGDTDRAYRYIGFMLTQVVHYPDYRNLTDLPEYLNKVYIATDEANLHKIQNNKRNFIIAMLVSAVLLLLFLAAAWMARRLFRYGRQLREKNSQLLGLQRELNDQVTETRRAAELLDNANRQKEKYIWQIWLISDRLISKLEDLRLNIYRLLKVGKNSEALNTAQDKESFWAGEMKEIETMFDKSFLDVYPGFVEDFNSLLREEERYPTDGKSLSTDLRIYALVWLGMDNSQKIANLLRLAPKTVYNIRLKVRGKALPSEEDFPIRVCRLGRVSYESAKD